MRAAVSPAPAAFRACTLPALRGSYSRPSLSAGLHISLSGRIVQRLFETFFVLARLARGICHLGPSLFDAGFSVNFARHAVRLMLGATIVVARSSANVDHPRSSMLNAELGPLDTCYAERRHSVAALDAA